MQKFLRDMYKNDGTRIAYELHFKSLTSSRLENFFTRNRSPLIEDYRAPSSKLGENAASIIKALSNDSAVHDLAVNVGLLKSLQFRKNIDPLDLSTYNYMGTANEKEGRNHFYHASQLNFLADTATALGDHAQMIRYFKHFQGYGGMLDARNPEDAAFLKEYHNPFLPASGRQALKDRYEQTFRQRESAFEASGEFPPGGYARILIGDSVVRVQTHGGLSAADANGVVRSGLYTYVTTEPTHVYDGGALHYRLEVAKDHVMSGVYGVGKSNWKTIDRSNVLFGELMWPIEIDVAYAKDAFVNAKLRGEIPHTLLFDEYLSQKQPSLLRDICMLKFLLKGDIFGIWFRSLVGPWADTKSLAEFIKVYEMNGDGIKDIMEWIRNPVSFTPQGERTVSSDQEGVGEWGIYVGEKKLLDTHTLIDLSKETEMKKILDDAIAEAVDNMLSSDKLDELDSRIDHAVDTLMTDPRIHEPASVFLNTVKDTIRAGLVDELFNTLSEDVPRFHEQLYTRADIELYIDRQFQDHYQRKYTLDDPLLLKDVEIAVLNAHDKVSEATMAELVEEVRKAEAIEVQIAHDLKVLREERDIAAHGQLEVRREALEVDIKKLEEVKEERRRERLEKKSGLEKHEKERLERKERVKHVNEARERLAERRGGEHGK